MPGDSSSSSSGIACGTSTQEGLQGFGGPKHFSAGASTAATADSTQAGTSAEPFEWAVGGGRSCSISTTSSHGSHHHQQQQQQHRQEEPPLREHPHDGWLEHSPASSAGISDITSEMVHAAGIPRLVGPSPPPRTPGHEHNKGSPQTPSTLGSPEGASAGTHEEAPRIPQPLQQQQQQQQQPPETPPQPPTQPPNAPSKTEQLKEKRETIALWHERRKRESRSTMAGMDRTSFFAPSPSLEEAAANAIAQKLAAKKLASIQALSGHFDPTASSTPRASSQAPSSRTSALVSSQSPSQKLDRAERQRIKRIIERLQKARPALHRKHSDWGVRADHLVFVDTRKRTRALQQKAAFRLRLTQVERAIRFYQQRLSTNSNHSTSSSSSHHHNPRSAVPVEILRIVSSLAELQKETLSDDLEHALAMMADSYGGLLTRVLAETRILQRTDRSIREHSAALQAGLPRKDFYLPRDLVAHLIPEYGAAVFSASEALRNRLRTTPPPPPCRFVFVVYQGNWSPLCVATLQAWQEHHARNQPSFSSGGLRLVGIGMESPADTIVSSQKSGARFKLLGDATGHQLLERWGLMVDRNPYGALEQARNSVGSSSARDDDDDEEEDDDDEEEEDDDDEEEEGSGVSDEEEEDDHESYSDNDDDVDDGEGHAESDDDDDDDEALEEEDGFRPGRLPMVATLIVDVVPTAAVATSKDGSAVGTVATQNTLVYAHVSLDPTQRAEPEDVLRIALSGSQSHHEEADGAGEEASRAEGSSRSRRSWKGASDDSTTATAASSSSFSAAAAPPSSPSRAFWGAKKAARRAGVVSKLFSRNGRNPKKTSTGKPHQP